jgi:hypothetical protein
MKSEPNTGQNPEVYIKGMSIKCHLAISAICYITLNIPTRDVFLYILHDAHDNVIDMQVHMMHDDNYLISLFLQITLIAK